MVEGMNARLASAAECLYRSILSTQAAGQTDITMTLHVARIVVPLVVGVLAAHSASAQSSVVTGVLVRDSGRVPLAGVNVAIPALDKQTSTNERGEYRLEGVRGGRYLITARRLGFKPAQDTVEVPIDAPVSWDVQMIAPPQMLDSVRIQSEQRKYVSPGLRGFEERRASGFGRFISEDQIRKQENEPLTDVLRSLPGAMLVRAPGGMYYFASTRKSCDGPVFLSRRACTLGTPDCYATIYLDGVLFYSPPPVDFDFTKGRAAPADRPPPDIKTIVSVKELAGVEYYASDAILPRNFTSGSNGCGTLLLWTRER